MKNPQTHCHETHKHWAIRAIPNSLKISSQTEIVYLYSYPDAVLVSVAKAGEKKAMYALCTLGVTPDSDCGGETRGDHHLMTWHGD